MTTHRHFLPGLQRPGFSASRWSRTAVIAWLTLALAFSGGGCATGGGLGGAYAVLEAVVIDGQRLAQGDDEVARSVRVWRDSVRIPARARMALQRGDVVQTGPNVHAVLRYDKAEVLMRPQSQGRVGSFTDVIGDVFAKIRGAFSVETTFVRAGANGTAYLVRGASDGTTQVTVFDGQVTLSSKVNAWAPRQVPTGEVAYCPPRGGAPQLRAATPQDLEQTRDWVEQVEKLVPQRTSYGSVAAVAGIAVLIGVILGSRKGGDRESPSTDSKPGASGGQGSGRSSTVKPGGNAASAPTRSGGGSVIK